MKVRASVKRLCEFCYTVRRRGKLFVYCKKTPRHKQRQWFATEAEGGQRHECVSCAAPLAPSAPSFALEAAAASSSSPALYSLSGLLMGGRTAAGGGAGFGGAGFTLGEVHRQAAMLLGGGRR